MSNASDVANRVSNIRICFLGTPDFAAEHLQTLIQHSYFKVAGVVTQPDRPSGRKMQLTSSAVKVLALQNNLEVLTPENLRKDSACFEKIKSWNCDIAVVVAFGQILNQEFLDHFRFGAVNIHGSLLPKWRGAAPIQRSIEAGDTNTGVSLQKMVKKLDAGPVIGERKIQLDHEITATALYSALSKLGCELLINELIEFTKGRIQPQDQDESQVTLAVKIEKEESLILWDTSAEKIHNKVRAFTMGPGTHCLWNGNRLKIHRTKVVDQKATGKISEVVSCENGALILQTGQGQISLLEVQLESKSKMLIENFLKSHRPQKGDLFV